MGIRLNKAMTILNVGKETIVEYLKTLPGLEPSKDMTHNTKLTDAQYEALQLRFRGDGLTRSMANTLFQKTKRNSNTKKSPSFSNNGTITVFEKKLPLKDLKYENHKLFFQMGIESFVLLDGFAPAYVRSNQYLAKENDMMIVIRINRSTHSFTFEDEGLLSKLNFLSFQVEKETKDKQNRKKERARKKEKEEKLSKLLDGGDKPIVKKNNKKRISFSQIKFETGIAIIKFDGKVYEYKHPGIKGVNTIIEQYLSSVSDLERTLFNNLTVAVKVNDNKNTFTFYKFDLINYCRNLKEKTEQKKKNVEKADDVQGRIHKSHLCLDNIEFFDGYFLVWVLKNGQKDTSIYPLKKDSSHSYSRLRYVHKYLSNRFPSDIYIKYDSRRVISLTKEYNLRDYIRILDSHKNDVDSEWWIEEMNSEKESLDYCRGIRNAKRKVALKNEFYDVLSSFQNEKGLIPAYEIDHGKKEEAFIFSIDMSGNRNAIVFENIKPARTTEFFVVKNENYELCLHRIFDHFTNYGFITKRYSLRNGKNVADSFNAELYCFIDHKNIKQWINCLTEKLELNVTTSDIAFVPGLRIPQNPNIRSGHNGPINIKNIHNELVIKLFDKLSAEYGENNVGTEISVGDRRIDVVVKKEDCIDIYEVKSASNSLDCVTEALGQIFLYAYRYCRDKIGKMVIAGQSSATKDVEEYLSELRKHSIPIYYIKV